MRNLDRSQQLQSRVVNLSQSQGHVYNYTHTPEAPPGPGGPGLAVRDTMRPAAGTMALPAASRRLTVADCESSLPENGSWVNSTMTAAVPSSIGSREIAGINSSLDPRKHA